MKSGAPPVSTLLLVDEGSESSPRSTRYRIAHNGTRHSFNEAVAAMVGRKAELQYLVEDTWLAANEFLHAEHEQEFAPKHVRCTSRAEEGGSAPLLQIAWRKFSTMTFAQGLDTDMLIGDHRVALPTVQSHEGTDGPHGNNCFKRAKRHTVVEVVVSN